MVQAQFCLQRCHRIWAMVVLVGLHGLGISLGINTCNIEAAIEHANYLECSQDLQQHCPGR